MKKVLSTVACITAATAMLVGCSSNTITPTYANTHTDLIRIGGEKPEDSAKEKINTGSYCIEVQETWKQGGETPDEQKIWVKDTFRSTVPCQ
jgi:hypothetical protein